MTKTSYPTLDKKQNGSLIRKVTNVEIKKAMFSIGGSQALGVDGYLAIFFINRTGTWLELVFATL